MSEDDFAWYRAVIAKVAQEVWEREQLKKHGSATKTTSATKWN